jgi:D-threo-aldose 1-dehydrogenase
MPKISQRNIADTGIEIDTLGFGCAPLGNLYKCISDADAMDVLSAAWDAGFRYFDTAPHYGQGLSERRVGDYLRQFCDQNYLLSSKVGRLLRPAGYATERHGYVSPMPFDFYYDYSFDGIMRSFEDSLQRLGLECIDILYMHDIGTMTHGDINYGYFKTAMDGGYRAMDELRSDGRVKAIGLGVNEWQVCEEALDYGDWDCFLLAGRYTLLEQEALDTFLPKCEKRNCSIIIGGAYNSGILARGVRGSGPHLYDYVDASDHVISKVAKIEAVCDLFDVPLAAAALQFPLAHPKIVSVIPGIGKRRRIASTLDLFNQTIPDEFWSVLKERKLIHSNAPTPKQVGML